MLLDNLNRAPEEKQNEWKTIIQYNNNREIDRVVLVFTDKLFKQEHKIIELVYLSDKYNLLNFNDIISKQTKNMLLDFLSQDSSEWWGDSKFNLIVFDLGDNRKLALFKKTQFDRIENKSNMFLSMSDEPVSDLTLMEQKYQFSAEDIEYFAKHPFKKNNKSVDNQQIRNLKRPVKYVYRQKTDLLKTNSDLSLERR